MRDYSPESLMMSFGYKPELSEGAIKCPIFQTSTFVFQSAEEGKAHFEVAYGLREKDENEEMGLIYSRINNPDLEILENRLCLWDKSEDCAVFESGMSAISTVLLEHLKPGDLLVHSLPLYGGTDHFVNHFLQEMGVETVGFLPGEHKETILEKIHASGRANRLKLIFIETPANPTNALIDISMCREIADAVDSTDPALVAVDNTYMGPVWQHPLKHGADLVLYSATKYIGGHSDLIAGAVLGSFEQIARIKTLRTFLGNMASPFTGWMLMRSLETLKVRMDKQSENALEVAKFLQTMPMVEKVYYPALEENNSAQKAIFQKQCEAPGGMISFDIKGGEAEAFAFLNALRLMKLAVSLGGTESLVEHPFSMTHAGIEKEQLVALGITPKMIRISVGIENAKDLSHDITQAFEKVENRNIHRLSPGLVG